MIIYSSDGQFEQINTTDIKHSISSSNGAERKQNFVYKPKSLTGELNDLEYSYAQLAEARVNHANFLAVRSPFKDNELILYECLTPVIK